MEECKDINLTTINGTVFCEPYWDSLICWPRTQPNKTVIKSCPKIRGSDTSKTISKHCKEDGFWELSYINYSECFTKEVLNILYQLKRMSQKEFQIKLNIAKITRIMEITGLTLSLLALILSFALFFYFRSLRNERTRIHMNLFVAAFIMVLMKLTLIIDQLIFGYGRIQIDGPGFDNTPVLCEITYIIMEYAKSATYMWMFIEALHLHRAVAVTATKMSFNKIYLFLGWGSTSIFILIWTFTMIIESQSHCWLGYNYNPRFWIIEGPRIIILLVKEAILNRNERKFTPDSDENSQKLQRSIHEEL
ncbi:hypothetical protein PGB90_003076 [Kerria lacca]